MACANAASMSAGGTPRVARDLAVHRRQHGLERGGQDVAVDGGAEQGRAVPEAQLDVAGGLASAPEPIACSW
jgi:hypothetical protein